MNGVGGRGTQRGAVAIEFAAVFVLFFAVLYGLLGYCVPLLMLQSFNDAAAAGARVAVSVNPQAPGGYNAALKAAVDSAVTERLSWMPASWRNGCYGGQFMATPTTESVSGRDYTRVQVCVSYPYATSPIVPLLTLPGIGTVPRLPDVLSGTASVLL
ncbi:MULTISPECIES: TadE/TadG family type IV pilus assembly protein [Pseudomonadaceae]|uniref:Pilus assembly protein n=1 Tax=Pseudomonas denitrificans TaxID=43306 RepID=A0A9X7N6W2_PSEDE|nr:MULTISPECIES: TadE/TadG family type IV pilus assembly protein [Pseudomonadaceae]OQR34699.1 pilus assembly protein [Pseudomonas sp. T]MBD9513572.1 pilus assembly protein [Pseudomonas sp. PDM22]MBD9632227.1 pilus assembly protein [Pseudomonas sp. PDM19]MBD9682836.1 pilus assembly protein [Pseudomonas sp. PDM20]QEY75716.1 pilus assembly protein [Pseudomonas denitrificans (nom. rej.)]